MKSKTSGRDYFPPIPAYQMDFKSYLALNKCDWSIDVNQAVLLIYDMQNAYVDRYEDPRPLLGNINDLRLAARAAGVPVIYAAAAHVHDPSERGIAVDLWGPGIGHGQPEGSDYNEIHAAIRPDPDDIIVRKSKYSVFFKTDFEAKLADMNRTQIILCGNYANHGCLITAVDAYMRNIKVFFVADALGAFDAASHDMALRYVADVCGQITLTEKMQYQIENDA